MVISGKNIQAVDFLQITLYWYLHFIYYLMQLVCRRSSQNPMASQVNVVINLHVMENLTVVYLDVGLLKRLSKL